MKNCLDNKVKMNKKELQDTLLYEKKLYLSDKYKEMKRSKHKRYLIWKYLCSYRKWTYYTAVRSDTSESGIARRLAKFSARYYERKKNVYSYLSGVEIGKNAQVGKGLDIWHSGVGINGVLGENCVLHGNNTIGNKGKGRENETPKIGSGVDIGAGAVIIGNVEIADDCIVAANAVVTKSFNDKCPITVSASVIGHIFYFLK